MTSCQTSSFLLYREVRYNFTSEGFLSPDLLQTIGKAHLPEDAAGRAARRACRSEALAIAQRRMLRVFLHTRLRLRPGFGSALGQGSSFERDYPVHFSPLELFEARIRFSELLRRSYIAVEDFRSKNTCLLVLRLSGNDLPAEIRNMPWRDTEESPTQNPKRPAHLPGK